MPARLVMCISVQKQIAQKWVQHDSSNCFLERLFAVICRKFTVKFLVFTNLQVPVFYTVSTAANWTLLKCLHTMITNVLMLFVIGVAWGGVRGGGCPLSIRISNKFAKFVGWTSYFYTHNVHKNALLYTIFRRKNAKIFWEGLNPLSRPHPFNMPNLQMSTPRSENSSYACVVCWDWNADWLPQVMFLPPVVCLLICWFVY